MKPKPRRVSIRADDAILVMAVLRHAIQQCDDLLARHYDQISADCRDEQYEAYLRICKALGLKPMVGDASQRPTPTE